MTAVSRPEPSASPMPTIAVRTRPSGGNRTKSFSIDAKRVAGCGSAGSRAFVKIPPSGAPI
jgi:hypothetical protein